MDRNDLVWTAFRASLLAPLLTGEVTREERGSYFRKLSQETHILPDGKSGTISMRTLRRWYQQLRSSGIDGLKPKRRSDRGQAQRDNHQKILRAVELKREGPHRSDQVINRVLKSEFGSGLARSTLYRHLSIQGATRKRLGVQSKKVRCQWTRDTPDSLWMGDFSHGPIVLFQGEPRQTHLSAWVDMHSRYSVDARFYLHENLDILVDSLLRAWAKHGAPRELYADNGKIYHSNGLVIACTKLAIKKLHRPPREPEPGGLIERFFQTAQSQFISEVKACQTLTFEQLNQAFSAWLQSAYHQQIHSVTGQTPDARYHTDSRITRHVDVTEVESYFYRSDIRTVDPTYSDVSIDKRLYRVDPRLRGMRVLVQFNPFRSDPQQPDEVKLYDLQDVYLGVGQRYERQRGAHPEPPSTGKPKPLLESPYIKCLLEDHQRKLAEACQAGISYQSAMQHDVLSLAQLCQHISRYLGRSGLSGLTELELEVIEVFYRKHPQVRSWQVPRAAEQAAGGGLPQLLWALQKLLTSDAAQNATSSDQSPPKEER
jgi:transposase InsO family protein